MRQQQLRRAENDMLKLGQLTQQQHGTGLLIENGFTNMNLSQEDQCTWVMIMPWRLLALAPSKQRWMMV